MNAINEWRLIGGEALCLVVDGEVHNIRAEHPNYSLVARALLAQEWDKVRDFLTIETAIEAYLEGKGVEIRDGKVFWNDAEVHGVLCQRITEAMEQGIDAQPFVNFLNKLMQNPSENSRKCLFNFVEKCGLNITPDGMFLGYKKVREDYMDLHSGTFSNKIGSTISMLRENVVENPDVACGPGLHVGTYHYAAEAFHAGRGRVMIVAVDPANVVSVPHDYDHQKMRCCEYQVVAEFTEILDKPVVDDYSDTKIERISVQDLDLVNYDTEVSE